MEKPSDDGGLQAEETKRLAKTEREKTSLWVLLLLHGGLLISSLSGVCSKKAALSEPFSMRFVFWYGLVLVSMFVYAVLWQQVLKRMDLTTAYANKPVSLVWAMVWGVLLFQETITGRMVLGAAVIFAGIYLVVTSENGQDQKKDAEPANTLEVDARK